MYIRGWNGTCNLKKGILNNLFGEGHKVAARLKGEGYKITAHWKGKGCKNAAQTFCTNLRSLLISNGIPSTSYLEADPDGVTAGYADLATDI